MIYFASNLRQLRDAVDSYIKILGENTPVCVPCRTSSDVDTLVTLDWICIDGEGNIVGDEANDYELKLKPGEMNAIRID